MAEGENAKTGQHGLRNCFTSQRGLNAAQIPQAVAPVYHCSHEQDWQRDCTNTATSLLIGEGVGVSGRETNEFQKITVLHLCLKIGTAVRGFRQRESNLSIWIQILKPRKVRVN